MGVNRMGKQTPLFVERRSGRERRAEPDRCAGFDFDLYHRKRRKAKERRTPGRSLTEDIAAFYASQDQAVPEPELH